MKPIMLIAILLTTITCSCQSLDTITNYSNNTSTLQSNQIPAKIFKMTNLKSLSITGMDCDYVEVDKNRKNITKCWMIQEIPSDIRHLKNLEYLQLNVNSITRIPREIGELNNLKIIDLTDNLSLQNIDNLTLVETLEELYLYGCSITKLPQDIGKLKHLHKLGLTGNNLSDSEIRRIKNELPGCEIIYKQ